MSTKNERAERAVGALLGAQRTIERTGGEVFRATHPDHATLIAACAIAAGRRPPVWTKPSIAEQARLRGVSRQSIYRERA